jgi:ATP-binding cassette subfamily C protein LapB
MEFVQDKIDPLLECLVFLSKFYAVPTSREALTSGLPLVDGVLSVPLFPRAAERAGFIAKSQRLSLDSLSPLLLPCILLQKDGGACVLLALDHEKDEACVVLPLLAVGNRRSRSAS